MAKIVCLVVIGFLCILFSVANAICCDSIKSLMEKKIEAHKTLCAAGNMLPQNCCKDIANEVEKHVTAYKTFCWNECTVPKALGMESGKITDQAITASSMYDGRYKPSNGRLNKNIGACGWTSTSAGRVGSWLQVDFGKEATVTGIATQGGCSNEERTKSYSVSYSNDAKTWTDYPVPEKKTVFQGNTDRNSIVKHTFEPSIRARFIRLLPLSWNGWPTTRVEYYGCIP